MRILLQSGLTGLALLFAGCATAANQIAIEAPEADPRITLNLPTASVEGDDAIGPDGRLHMTVTGRPYTGKWTGGFGAYMRTMSNASCPAGTAVRDGERIEIKHQAPTILKAAGAWSDDAKAALKLVKVPWAQKARFLGRKFGLF